MPESMQSHEMSFCTLFDRNYHRKGMALYNSMIEWIPDFHLYILAMDEKTWQSLSKKCLPNVTVINWQQWEWAELAIARENRSWTEYLWMLASVLSDYCLNHFKVESIIYIDADTFFLSPIESLKEELKDKEIAITPHRFDTDHKWREQENGKYNVGLVYFKNCPEARSLLKEWKESCLKECSAKTCGDQLIWNEFEAKYPVYAIQHPGVGVAPWNQAQYHYRYEDGNLMVENDSLIMYHMHELRHDTDGTITKLTGWPLNEGILPVYELYQRALWNVILD